MTERHGAFAIVQGMEDDVDDIGRWADVLRDLGTGDGEVSKNGLFVIGGVMIELAARLDQKWKAAFTAMGGQT